MNSNGQFEPLDPLEYLKSKIAVDPATGCWNWVGLKFDKGYGYFKCKAVQKTPLAASRASWIIHRGHPGNLFVLHQCDNRACCNPDHLFLGTQKKNMEDCKAKGRMNRGEDRPQSKLTDDEVTQIRRMKAQGASYGALAERFNVSRSLCFYAVKVGWQHVGPS